MSTVTAPRHQVAALDALMRRVRALPAAPLRADARRATEMRTGVDLSGVRVHLTAEASDYARRLGARGFTFGDDIVVGADGDTETLLHEAAHAAQFRYAGTPAHPTGVDAPGAGADRQAAAFARGQGTPLGEAPASPGGMIQRQELQKKDSAAGATGRLLQDVLSSPRGAQVYGLLPPGLKASVQVYGSIGAFIDAFVTTAAGSLSAEDYQRLKAEFSGVKAPLAYTAGLYGGIPVGIAEDVASNIVGLWEIVKVIGEFLIQPVMDTAMALYDFDLYLEVKREEAEHAKKVIEAISGFAAKVVSDPKFLIGGGDALGGACGELLATWFRGDFMSKSPIEKGFAVGRGIGMAATEVALLFLGPEEWIARGAVAVGRVARGSRLFRVLAEILEKVPEIGRLFKAKHELDEAQKALKAAKKAETIVNAAEEAGKGEKVLAAAGEATKPGAPPTKIPELKPRAPEPKPGLTSEPNAGPVKVGAEPKAQPTKAELTNAGAEPKPAPEPKPGPQPEPKAEPGLKDKPEPKAKPKPEPKPKAEPTKAEPTKAASEPKPGPGPKAEPKPEPTKAASKPKAEPEPKPKAEPEKAASTPKAKVKPEPGSTKKPSGRNKKPSGTGELAASKPPPVRRLPNHATEAQAQRVEQLLDDIQDAGIPISDSQFEELMRRIRSTRDEAELDAVLSRLEADLASAKDINGVMREARGVGTQSGSRPGDTAATLPEGTHAQGSTPNPRTAELTDAELLAANLEKSVGHRPPGHEAHHVVPKRMESAEEARQILRNAGIGINDAENGMWLPKDSATPNPGTTDIHSKVHTDRAMKILTEKLREGAKEGPEGVRRALREMREILGGGRYER